MNGCASFVGAAMSVMFFAWLAIDLWHCGFHFFQCVGADLDCLSLYCHKPF